VRPSAAAAVGIAGTALAVHAGPALVGVPPIGERFAPALMGVGRRGHVAISFDDGPDPASTPVVLGALDRIGWRATFFMLGSMVRTAPSLAREVVAAGHEVALHGDAHQNLLRRTPRRTLADLERATASIVEATGVRPQWFRPPYGILSGGAWYSAHALGLRTVLWTNTGRDWRAEATAGSVTADVMRHRLDGGTVLLHDSDCTSAPGSWRATVGALPLLAAEVERCGLLAGTVGEHGIGVTGVTR
jgi:peptidoglycan-N-acetylglucosamine deacetylase